MILQNMKNKQHALKFVFLQLFIATQYVTAISALFNWPLGNDWNNEGSRLFFVLRVVVKTF